MVNLQQDVAWSIGLVKMIMMTELYFQGDIGPINLYNNPNLVPETGWTTELGIKKVNGEGSNTSLKIRSWRTVEFPVIRVTEKGPFSFSILKNSWTASKASLWRIPCKSKFLIVINILISCGYIPFDVHLV